MKEIAERTEFGAALSVPTIDERAWRATEPHTPEPSGSTRGGGELTAAGIRTGVLVAPLMPGINDKPEQVAKILERASEAGAAYVTGIALHLRGEVKDVFFDWLAENRPSWCRAIGGFTGEALTCRRRSVTAGRDGQRARSRPPAERMRGRTRARRSPRRSRPLLRARARRAGSNLSQTRAPAGDR